MYVKENGQITNAIYQELNSVGKTTATEDLQILVELRLLIKQGKTGRGAKYVIG